MQRGDLWESPPEDDDWYLHLLWIDRRKCLLFTHAGTLFSVFVADARKADLISVGSYVVNAIAGELRAEGLSADALGRLDPGSLRLERTASRSVLGFMNDIAADCRHQVAQAARDMTTAFDTVRSWTQPTESSRASAARSCPR